ncbi:MAG: ABC transporter permease [Propionicimonas sp.]
MELLWHALARLRGDLRRSLATGFAVLVAVASFVVLTGTAQTQRLEVTQTLEENFRGAYDILVRPAGSTRPLEAETGQVRSAFLSGVYGGITLDQVAQIQDLGGIEAAAPIAMLGTTYHHFRYEIDITDLMPDAERFILRYTSRAQARNGNIDLDDTRGFLYLTRAPFTTEHFEEELPGSTYSGDRLVEMVDGVKRNPCFTTAGIEYNEQEPWANWSALCASLDSGNDAIGDLIVRDGRALLPVWVAVPLQVAAIDPEAEATLLGVDETVTAGRYLTATDAWVHGINGEPETDDPEDWLWRPPYAPALLAGSLEADYQLAFAFELLPEQATEDFLATPSDQDAISVVTRAAAERSLAGRVITAPDLYDGFLAQNPPSDGLSDRADGWEQAIRFTQVFRPGEVEFEPGTPLRPVALEPASRLTAPQNYPPRTVADTAFRAVQVTAGTDSGGIESISPCEDGNQCWSGVLLNVVGLFDPARIQQEAELGSVPLEEYTAARLVAADDASREAIGADVLRSDLNLAGYSQLPPSILISLNSLPLLDATRLKLPLDAPVSAVRVRVAGVAGLDRTSRERVRLVAERIQQTTGLDVDITIGSSQTAQRVELPATALGVPALNLDELWSQKGVAIAVTEALDTKSLLLFALILASSALTVAVSANAAVQARRRELGTLACLGWSPGRLRREVLLELTLIGAGAGVLGALVAWPLALVLQVAFDGARAASAVPIAVALTLLAGLPAIRAAGRIAPIDALRPPVLQAGRRSRPVGSALALGARQLLRRPGRLAMGAIAVGIAAASITLLASIVVAFQGAVVGTFLGDAVALQVRAPDLIAAGCLTLLGVVAVATIGFLGIIEDATSYAALQAVGWRDASLGGALATQAALIGAVGGVAGGALGIGLVAWLVGDLNPATLTVAAAAAAFLILLAIAASLAPAAWLRRLPVARILAEE